MKLIDNSLPSFRVTGKLPQWAYWSIAAVFFALSWFGVNGWARAYALHDLSNRVDEWSDEGVLIQETNYTCVPSSLVMLLKNREINITTLDATRVAGTSFFGTDGSGIIKAGKHYGFDVHNRKIGAEELLSLNEEVIVIFRYKGIMHAAAVAPIADMGMFDVRDSVEGRM